ncbi:MAG: lactate racemase domain-containing protein [Phycisphaerae bacterium]
MLLSSRGLTDGYLTDSETYFLMKAGLDQVSLNGKKVLVLIPDSTRTCPLPMLFRHLVDLVGSKVAKLDFLIALGTHQPMPEDKINALLGVTEEERKGIYKNIGIYNHNWQENGTFKTLGTISADDIHKISKGLMRQEVPVGINKMVLDYDQLMILGPTFPHEVVGFSGGLKYLFPGIADWEIINFFHWLGAMITTIKIIGVRDTPVRALLNKAVELVPVPILNIDLVVRDGRLAGIFIGDAKGAFDEAADLSDKLHIVYKDRPYRQVIGIAPEMYDDIWTAGKCMYKLEPIVADGGELVIYAPHVTEISYTHGKTLDKVGYHVRDYFARQMDKFKDVPGGIMAHSTHVRGLGTFENGMEKPRITVTLATGISRQRTEMVQLNYRDPASINIDSYRNRENEGILVVDHAGEILHRLREPEKWITIPE